ncbi:MAG: hypothetical protein ACRDBY_14270 [Cetobacterium sp.]
MKRLNTWGIVIEVDMVVQDLNNMKVGGVIMNMDRNMALLGNELYNLYKRKNKDYGDSAVVSFERYGMVAYLVRAEDKMNRFLNLQTKEKTEVLDETIDDTVLDLVVYTAIYKAYKDNGDKISYMPVFVHQEIVNVLNDLVRYIELPKDINEKYNPFRELTLNYSKIDIMFIIEHIYKILKKVGAKSV